MEQGSICTDTSAFFCDCYSLLLSLPLLLLLLLQTATAPTTATATATLGEALDGNVASVWPSSQNAALRAEQIALTAAVLWATQFAPMLRAAQCHLHFDCVAAGWSANGDWKAPDEISEKLHHIELFSRDLIAGGIRFHHVRAHADDPWDELADVLAKAVSRRQLQLCAPPAELCQVYLSTDWTWLATELQARLHGVLPVRHGELAWASSTCYSSLSPLTAEQLVPTTWKTWGATPWPASFAVSVATLNTQGTAGKFKYFEEQLLAMHNNILFLQEHKGQAQFCLSKAYMRLHTECKKHWGVGIWLSRRHGTITLDSKPRFTDESDLAIKYESERLLVVEVNLGGQKLLLASAHMAGEWKGCGARARLWRPKFDLGKLRSPEGKALVAQELEKYIPPAWDTHPDRHCQHLQEYLQGILCQHFKMPANAPKTAFMPDKVWQWRSQKLQLRARTRPRRQSWQEMRNAAFRAWRRGEPVEIGARLVKAHMLHGIISAAIKFITYKMKLEIRRAKDAYLRQAAAGPEPQTAANHMLRNLKAAGLGKKALRPISRQLPMLLDESQVPVTTREDRDKLWLSHFGKQECGETILTEDFVRDPHPPVCQDADIEWSFDMLPSMTELENMFRRAPHNKAAGLDAIPGEMLKASPSHLAKAVQALMLKAVMTIRQPLQWRGGVLYSAWKRSGDRSHADSHRSLFVSNLLAKSLHRLMKDKVAATLEATLHPLHLGSRRGAPVTFPAMYILAHQRDTLAKGESSGILFLDTKAAYYRVAREVAVGRIVDDETVAKVFQHFQLDPQEIHELLEVIKGGGVMGDVSMPTAARHAAKDYHHRAWFASSYSDGTKICLTRAGSRPGESWADCVFAFVYSKVLYHVAELVRAEGLIDATDHDPSAGVFGRGTEGEPIHAVDGTWADDSAFPLRDRQPEVFLTKRSV